MPGSYEDLELADLLMSELDAKGGAYKSALPEWRAPALMVVRRSLSSLSNDAPLVTTAKGIYKQRIFAGLFPTKIVVNEVARMFSPPDLKRR